MSDITSYQNDKVLKKWIKSYYLLPDTILRIKEGSKAKPFCKYAVLDNFFNNDIFEKYAEDHYKLVFNADDSGLPYDSSWAMAKENSLGAELFYHQPWHNLLAEYTDTELVIGSGNTSVKLRSHDSDSKGFWIHTDRTIRKSEVAMAALIYLNKDWKQSDGAVLQMWAEINRASLLNNEDVEFRWKHYKDKRLDFLSERNTLTTHVVKYDGVETAEVILLDQIMPEYNRLVVTDFVRDPAYHSITPSNGRIRHAIVQWLM